MATTSRGQDEAATIRSRIDSGSRIGFVSGNFNVVHPGHLRILRYAAENSDVLVVGVTRAGTRGAAVPTELRLEGVKALSFVGFAVELETEPADFIRHLQPDKVFKGKEYEDLDNAEQDAVASYGGKLEFCSGEMRFVSNNIIDQEYTEVNLTDIKVPRDYPARHKFTADDLRATLTRFEQVRVLVIGDLIVDKYVDCDPIGMSQEDPTIVVSPIAEKTFVGGAGIVAAHAKGMGADVRFLTVCGADETADYAEERLKALGVKAELFRDHSRPTTTKQRYRAHGKTLLRVNRLRQHSIDKSMIDAVMASVDRILPDIDLLLFSDFNYGCLPQTLVDAIAEKAAARGIMMAADSQASSQLADIARFKGMTLITPTEREARLALQDFQSGLVVVGEHLREAARCANVVITLGAEGLLVHAGTDSNYGADRLPAFNNSPRDVAGAGDSFFTCASLALCSGANIWHSTFLGALAAACQVSRVGNTPLTRPDVLKEIATLET